MHRASRASDGLPDDGLQALSGGASRIAEVDLVVLAGTFVALLDDVRVQPLDRRALRGVRADVHDLGGESLGEVLEAEAARWPGRRLPRRRPPSPLADE